MNSYVTVKVADKDSLKQEASECPRIPVIPVINVGDNFNMLPFYMDETGKSEIELDRTFCGSPTSRTDSNMGVSQVDTALGTHDDTRPTPADSNMGETPVGRALTSPVDLRINLGEGEPKLKLRELKAKNNKNVVISHININSIRNKFDKLKQNCRARRYSIN